MTDGKKMHVRNHVVWLTYMGAVAISASLAFNIGTTTPHISTMEPADFSRNKLLQFAYGKNKVILDAASQQLIGSEEPCKPHQNHTHSCLIIPEISLTDTTIPIKHFRLSIAADSAGSQFTVCSPNIAHECNKNSFLNNVCYKMTELQQVSSFTPASQECTKKTVDLIFLFDGSGSMTEEEFTKNKDFIVDIMDSLKNTSIKFAAVQFSSDHRKVFDFNDYQAGTALDKLEKEPHMMSLTNTHRALRFVLEHILENPDAGASPDATKVLVIITDGDPSDLDSNGIIKRYRDKKVIRFVIGVNDAKLDKFTDIASEPTDKYTFKIEDYNGLTDLLENFQKGIFEIKEDKMDEISQSGFRAVFCNVCNSRVVHDCHEDSRVNSVCYKMADPLLPDSSFTSASQEYTKKTVDLVFLFDGSGSMTKQEFTKNKDFIVDIMDSLKNTSIKFAAVQFSSDHRKVFDFNDYQAGTALDKLEKEPHMMSLTNTHRALRFVLEHILENPDAGASPDATKVLVIITDGDPSDLDSNGIIKRYQDKKVIRFVIGVNDAKLDKFTDIASEPTDKYAFKIEDYNGLTDLLENFQKGIFEIKEDKMDEISQSGFRAVFCNVCNSRVVHDCHEDSRVNSVCYKMADPLLPDSSFTSASQEYTKNTVDLVFLFDGSGSMTKQEFTKNKDFIVDIMDSLKNTSIKFAAVQFSSDHRKVFDFNDYQAGTALDKLEKEPHMMSLTNTHRALRFVLEHILENPDAGASPDATKVLVIITDGDPSDLDSNGIIKRYQDKKVIRFVIGVNDAKLDKFTDIASEPTDKYAFKIEDYNGLTDLLENFQKGIFEIKEDKMDEISQSGFRAVFCNDTLILGSVGSNIWQGSLQNPHMKNDSYMGYSIAVGEKNNARLYFTGAPRFEHKGQVVLFKHNGMEWTVAQRLNGDQIGSYFGAELCSVDIDSDRNSDFLLVGAPLFYQLQEKKEGQIYIYTLTDEMQLKSELNVTAPSLGRFGTTISSLADLNGDGLRDVAVGAPLEDDNRGAVYIYLGDRQRGIRSAFSQRIMGQKINPELRFFGQAIDGDIDLGEDRLPQIVIGSQDTAVVLRSRPVFNVLARLSFQPEEISTEKIACQGNTDENVPMVTLTVCFEMVETTKSKAGTMNSGLNISYTLDLDPMRQTNRGFFSPTDKVRNLTSTCELRNKDTCFNFSIYMPTCVEDTSSPVGIRLNFLQVDSESASAVLNVDSNRQLVVEVPFKK